MRGTAGKIKKPGREQYAIDMQSPAAFHVIQSGRPDGNGIETFNCQIGEAPLVRNCRRIAGISGARFGNRRDLIRHLTHGPIFGELMSSSSLLHARDLPESTLKQARPGRASGMQAEQTAVKNTVDKVGACAL